MDKPKKKFDRRIALLAAKEVVDAISPACERIIVAGSLRRRKLYASDAELLYIPTFKTEKDGLFDTQQVNQVDLILEKLIKDGIIEKRKNALGSFVFGPKNKLMLHVPTGIPVDFFSVLQQPCPVCSIQHASTGSDHTPRPAKPEAVQSEMRCVPKTLSDPQPEGVQQNVLGEASMARRQGAKDGQALPDDDVHSVPSKVSEQELLEGKEGVFSEMQPHSQSESDAGKAKMDGSKGIQKQSGVHSGVRPQGEEARLEKRIDTSAPISDSETPGEVAQTMGVRAPQKREEGRQPIGESGNREQQKAPRPNPVSSLLENISHSLKRPKCELCGGLGWIAPTWFNYLVCRTGGARNNILIAEAYKRKGLHWDVYGIGYTDRDGNRHRNVTEQDVYANAGLKYLEPHERP